VSIYYNPKQTTPTVQIWMRLLFVSIVFPPLLRFILFFFVADFCCLRSLLLQESIKTKVQDSIDDGTINDDVETGCGCDVEALTVATDTNREVRIDASLMSSSAHFFLVMSCVSSGQFLNSVAQSVVIML